jgi:hypothetical protein
MSSVRTQDKKTDKTDDPDVKYFRTKDGKECRFSPEEMIGISELI